MTSGTVDTAFFARAVADRSSVMGSGPSLSVSLSRKSSIFSLEDERLDTISIIASSESMEGTEGRFTGSGGEVEFALRGSELSCAVCVEFSGEFVGWDFFVIERVRTHPWYCYEWLSQLPTKKAEVLKPEAHVSVNATQLQKS